MPPDSLAVIATAAQRLAKLSRTKMDGGAGKNKAVSAVKKFTRTAA
jgi:hypothetical protein